MTKTVCRRFEGHRVTVHLNLLLEERQLLQLLLVSGWGQHLGLRLRFSSS